MAGLTRRDLVAGTALGIATAAATVGGAPAATAQAALPDEPVKLLGHVANGMVELPPLLAPTELEGRPPNPEPPARRLGIAVVGLGHVALTQIIPAFGETKHVRLAALVSGERDKAAAVAAQYGVPDRGLYDYATYDRLRDDPDVDIVYVALPNAMHREYTERAARAGKHVLCEKPMATSVADAQAMIEACRKAGKLLMIAYRCQYEPYSRTVTQMARAGEYGPIRLIRAVNGQNNADNGQWRADKAMAGGGSLVDVGIYCLNAARTLTGREPIEVSARLTRPPRDPRFREVEDLVSFTLRFPNDVLAVCESGYSIHDSRALRVMAPEAWYGLDPAFGYSGLALHIGRKIGQSNAVETRHFAPHSQFALEMDHFAEAIRGNFTPRTPGEEGLADMKMIAAIYQSAAAGSPITFPETPGYDTTRGRQLSQLIE